MKKTLLTAAIMSMAFSSTVFAHGVCDTTLHGYMENIKDEMRAMSSDVKAGDSESAVGHVEALISYFEKSRSEAPHKFSHDNLQGAELKAQTAEYQKVVDDTITILKELEGALKAGDSAKVRDLFGAIGEQRNLGHRSFKDC
ncbi:MULTISPECIES: cytochrome b562 [Marinomonas]|uniref:Cytochrome b562 n=1 Tax=Marinomonas alcarazii TaxID=491949 RepID=A0A318VAY3_9GAMM|nr:MULTISPECIES: cytochrome b562 [Marinomonas]PYF84891.1 cytochrome b562 [Marinomonas alcarazii]